MISSWATLQLHELTVVVYHAGGAIHEVEWKKAYVVDDSSKENQEHRDRIYITYRW